jgi:hypothetical protein
MSAIMPTPSIRRALAGEPVRASLVIAIGARRRIGKTMPAQSLRGAA